MTSKDDDVEAAHYLQLRSILDGVAAEVQNAKTGIARQLLGQPLQLLPKVSVIVMHLKRHAWC